MIPIISPVRRYCKNCVHTNKCLLKHEREKKEKSERKFNIIYSSPHWVKTRETILNIEIFWNFEFVINTVICLLFTIGVVFPNKNYQYFTTLLTHSAQFTIH